EAARGRGRRQRGRIWTPGRPEVIERLDNEGLLPAITFESGRARLHKYVVTEEVTRSVPVSHEEVRVVREPLQPGEKVTGTTDFGEQDVEVTLHAERATVRKEAVPVERVRLETERVTEQKEVSAEIRKEKIDYADGKEMGTGKDAGGEFGQGRRR
ncbi:YsnF/AvaK domain-containing protein, partial [Streptomyces sp. ZEA17I]|uniref:YsnF/AvaK domain-containing protein n=1 Tax=Streptomyces sp. ZEA17I TaxID=2202516 RepID=UPI0035C2180A